MKKRLFFLAAALWLSLGSAFAQSDIYGVFNRIGLNAGVSTEGITVGIATPITPYLNIDAEPIVIPKPGGSDTYTFSKVKLEGNFNRTIFNARLSVYPFGERAAFFIAGGLSFGGEKIAKLSGHSDEVARLYQEHPEYSGLIAAEIGKYEIVIDHQGNVEGDVRVKSVRPYVGLGYGRLVPKNRVGFRVEAGCQFMGKMKVYQNGVEMPDILSSAADDDLSKIIDKWSIYPVLRLTITGRIL